MGVLINMFTQLARLGVTRAAAFFYAVAVGVVANVVIAHFSPHPGDTQAVTEPIALKSTDAPVATALIGPKPTQPPVQTLDVSGPVTPPPAAAPVATNASAATAFPKNPPPPDVPVSAVLPDSSAMTVPPLKPAALSSAPVAAEPVATADLDRLARDRNDPIHQIGIGLGPQPGVHPAHRAADYEPQMRDAEPLGDQSVAAIDHVAVAIMREMAAQPV